VNLRPNGSGRENDIVTIGRPARAGSTFSVYGLDILGLYASGSLEESGRLSVRRIVGCDPRSAPGPATPGSGFGNASGPCRHAAKEQVAYLTSHIVDRTTMARATRY
jgi:hypothetical protein